MQEAGIQKGHAHQTWCLLFSNIWITLWLKVWRFSYVDGGRVLPTNRPLKPSFERTKVTLACSYSTIDNLGFQQRRRPRGNRAGQLVRQRQQVYVTVAKCETESETVVSSKPIPVVRSSSRRRARRSILPPRHQLTRVVAATTSPPVTPPHDARSPAASAHLSSSSSAASWRPSLSSDGQSSPLTPPVGV